MKPATAAVLRLLRARGLDGLTEAESTAAIGCRRLAARVWELRHVGYDIESVTERAPNGALYSRYTLDERPEPMTGEQEGMEEFLREGLPEFTGVFR